MSTRAAGCSPTCCTSTSRRQEARPSSEHTALAAPCVHLADRVGGWAHAPHGICGPLGRRRHDISLRRAQSSIHTRLCACDACRCATQNTHVVSGRWSNLGHVSDPLLVESCMRHCTFDGVPPQRVISGEHAACPPFLNRSRIMPQSSLRRCKAYPVAAPPSFTRSQCATRTRLRARASSMSGPVSTPAGATAGAFRSGCRLRPSS